MAFQPFALDQYFKDMIEGGISQGKGREQWFDEKEKRLQVNPFDMKVANALANGEVEMTINKNTK